MHAISALLLTALLLQGDPAPSGPIIGDLTAHSIRIWVKSDRPGRTSVLLHGGKEEERSCGLWTRGDRDNTGFVQVVNLEENTRYTYSIDGKRHDDWWFRTRSTTDETCRIAFGSCANEGEGSSSVWRRIEAEKATALVLLGDTPYIDTTDLARQRERYMEFASVPAFASLVAHTPLYSIWDDHDFGRNDTDGTLPDKENSRRAFLEYRPNPDYGEDGEGIYTNFRQGPVEVFLLDARWFARTQGGEDAPTLLGAKQWDWLERSLRASTAPYKVLACGMVFNGAVRPGKTDCWGAYPAEYARLLDVIAGTGATGVVLVSGDLHWSRVIRHDTKDTIGYDLIECVTSPIHEKLIKAADAPHPGLLFSAGAPNSFLLLEAAMEEGTPTLSMILRTAAGDTLHHQQFVAPPGT